MTMDYEAEYNNRARVANAGEIMEGWAQRSKALLAHPYGDYDVRYGAKERNKADFHHANSARSGPWVIYIHGGYWQRGDRKDYAFVAQEFLKRGINVAIPSYSLCPDVGVGEIIQELRRFLIAFWSRTKARPVIVGHSAGGHLAACLMAMSFREDADTPEDLVRAAYALSGVYDLEPLIPTSLNAALHLDPATARAASPLFGAKPAKNRQFIASVGALESTEFLRQSLVMTDAWSRAGVKAECVVIPSANHFTIVDQLAHADSAMFHRIVELAQHMRNL